MLIKEDFNVLHRVVARQVDLILQIFSAEAPSDVYDQIEMNETIIDGLELKIRSEVMNGMILYTPRASDARRMFSLHDMTGYLERIGDLLLNVAHFAHHIDLDDPISIAYIPTLREMLQISSSMLADALVSFFSADTALSREVIARDQQVDDLHKQVMISLPQSLYDAGEHPYIETITASLSINSIAYNIERVGDNATNVAEAAIFHSEGKDMRHFESLQHANQQVSEKQDL